MTDFLINAVLLGSMVLLAFGVTSGHPALILFSIGGFSAAWAFLGPSR